MVTIDVLPKELLISVASFLTLKQVMFSLYGVNRSCKTIMRSLFDNFCSTINKDDLMIEGRDCDSEKINRIRQDFNNPPVRHNPRQSPTDSHDEVKRIKTIIMRAHAFLVSLPRLRSLPPNPIEWRRQLPYLEGRLSELDQANEVLGENYGIQFDREALLRLISLYRQFA